jgi:hypothetical protein
LFVLEIDSTLSRFLSEFLGEKKGLTLSK